MNKPVSWSRGPVEPFFGDLQVHTYTFRNGLTLKVVPDHSAPVVAYQTWYGVGSADEVEGKSGLAHLFEHMMFKGTEAYGEGEFQARLDALGATGLNAWTWYDQTVYMQAVPADHVDAVADLESTRMHQLVVDDEAFTTELGVVINERKMSVDNDPRGKLAESQLAAAFEAHPYGKPTIGWMRDLERLSVGDAVGFYRSFYAPDNATLLLVGDIEPDDAANLIDARYGDLPASEVRKPQRAPEPPQEGQRRLEESFPIAADRVSVMFKVPPFPHHDTPALLVLDTILTGGQTGRLNRALRQTGTVSRVSSSIFPLRDPTVFHITLLGRPGVSAEVAEAALWHELERVREHGVSDGELQMGRRQWQSMTWSHLEDAMGKADFLGWTLTHTGSHLDGMRRIEAIAHVTADDVLRVARAYLRPDQATVAIGRADDPAPYLEVDAGEVAPAARVTVEGRELRGEPDYPAGELVEREIGGAETVLAFDATLPLVHFRWYLRGGSSALDPAGKEGLAWLAGRALLRGTARRSRQEFEEALEQLGASLGVSVDADGTLISGTALAPTWPAFVALVTEAVSSPGYRDEDLAQLVREVEGDLKGIVDNDDELAHVAARRELHGATHPYGRDPRGTLSSVHAISTGDLRAFHDANLRSEGSLVAIAGAFDAGIEDDVAELVGAITGAPVSLPQVVMPAPAVTQRIVLVDKPGRTQAAVMAAWLRVKGKPASA